MLRSMCGQANVIRAKECDISVQPGKSRLRRYAGRESECNALGALIQRSCNGHYAKPPAGAAPPPA